MKAYVNILFVLQADVNQKHLQLSEAKKIDADGLVRFFTINNIHYITEYNQAVLKHTDVSLHLSSLLVAA